MASKKQEEKKTDEPKDTLVAFHYEDAPDKPDPGTKAQVQVIDSK